VNPMKKTLLVILLLSILSAVFAWTDQPYVVSSDSGKTLGVMKLTAGAKDLGSTNNPLWTRSTIVDGNGNTIDTFGGTTTAISNIEQINGTTVYNPSYITPVGGTDTPVWGMAILGAPDVWVEGDTRTAYVLTNAFTNGAGLNVTITGSGTLITQNLLDYYLDTISYFQTVTKTGNVTDTNAAGWYNIKTGAKKMYLTINGTNPTASNFTINVYRNATPSAIDNTITAYSLNGTLAAATLHNVYYDFLYAPDNSLWEYNKTVVLLPSTNYLINIVPSVTQAILGIKFKWYEI